MFERFSAEARKVLVIAQNEALALGHNFIGTEHVLLGLLGEGTGVAAQILAAGSVTLDGVRARVTDLVPPSTSTPSTTPPFTPRAKKCLELALRECLDFGHDHIGTAHLLLGLLREGEGVAAQLLVEQGFTLSSVRSDVV